MYGLAKKALFAMDPERAHHLANAYLSRMHRAPALLGILAHKPPANLATEAFGLRFPTPLGIAAGFDKEANVYNALFGLGFGHVEIGTVTPEPQPGNPKPRVWRVPEQQALVNAMGFPGPGFDAIVERVLKVPPRGVLGFNIGPNKDRPREESLERLTAMARDAPGDYVALNVSSPNTPGLRDLQQPEAIASFIGKLRDAMDDGTAGGMQAAGNDRPLLLKLHPDDPNKDIIAVAKAAIDAGAAGIIATNTTRARPEGIPDHPGGLSGAPLRARSLGVVTALCDAIDAPVVGVGGVSTGADVQAMLGAGAALVQAYTGFIYRGPTMARQVHRTLARLESA